jgi:hypothetical protein
MLRGPLAARPRFRHVRGLWVRGSGCWDRPRVGTYSRTPPGQLLSRAPAAMTASTRRRRFSSLSRGVPPSPLGDGPGVFPKLVADLDLGLAAYLLTDARAGRAEAKVYGPDVPLQGCAAVDQVLVVPATPARQATADYFGRNARVAFERWEGLGVEDVRVLG